jgi:hypothetical protein
MGHRNNSNEVKENTRRLYHEEHRVSIHEAEWYSVHYQAKEKKI